MENIVFFIATHNVTGLCMSHVLLISCKYKKLMLPLFVQLDLNSGSYIVKAQ